MLIMALPIIIANASVPLLGVCDTAVVARLQNTEALAAVAVGSSLYFFVLWTFGFLRMTTSGLTGQAVGAQSLHEPYLILFRALLLALGIGLLLAALGTIFLGELGLNLMGAEENVISLGRLYLDILFWAAPGQLIVYVIHGWLLGHGMSWMMFLIHLGIGLVNLGLNILFTLIWGMGVTGVGLATVTSSSLGACVGLLLVVNIARKRGYHFDRNRLWKLSEIAPLATLNSHVMIRTILLIASFAAFHALSARFGAAVLAAHAVLLHFIEVAAFAVDGISDVVESYAARFWGARKKAYARESLARGLLLAGLFSIAISFAYLLVGFDLILLIAPLDDVLLLTNQLAWFAFFTPIMGFACYVLDGYFLGLTKGRTIRNSMFMASTGYGLVLLALYPWAGPQGLWVALWCLLILRALTLGFVATFRHPTP